ncbi:MAG: HAD family phosphatase [Candidatus Altiarchaeota archaeon]|nr:HAD family phosphatase [Candidatus Altiarchaeota archaeon]
MPAVIFDLDGTLVDLFDVHLAGFKAVLLHEFGLNFERRDLSETYGKSGEEIIGVFLKSQGIIDADCHSLAKARRKWVIDNLVECKLLPGAVEILTALKAEGFKVGLGTSNTENIGEKIVSAGGLSNFFDAKAYRSDDIRSKPFPDIFLKAASLLGEAPMQCIVVEDSVHGIAAAKAAGMKSVAVATGTHTFRDLESMNPEKVVKSLNDVDVSVFRSLLKV